MAIHEETPLKPFWAIAVLVVLLLSVCFLPFIGLRELFGREGEFAAIACEISWRHPFPVAQGELLPYRYPLFPLIARLFMDFGLSVEWALRGVGFIALTAMAVMTYDSASRALQRVDAGAIAAAVVLTNVFMIDRALWGVPDLLGAALIQAAWLLLFTFGMVMNRWRRAWFAAAVLVTLAFLTVGPGAPFLFIVPILFMTRPFSGLTRLLQPSGLIALISVLSAIAAWEIFRVQGLPEASAHASIFGIFTHWSNNNFLWFLGAPLDVFLRLLPWSLLIYPAFCPAYKPFEENPIFVRYTKTLFIVVLLMVLLIPWFRISDDAKILIPMFAVLISMQYPIFIRRNGTLILRLLQPLNILLLLGGLLLLGYHSLAPQIAGILTQITPPEQGFTADFLCFFYNIFSQENRLIELHGLSVAMACYVIFLACLLLSPFGRKLPVWAQIALYMAALSQVYWATSYHRKVFDTEQSNTAKRLGYALQSVTKTPISELTLYKEAGSSGLYVEGVYLGAKIVRIRSATEIPRADSQVFLISADVPVPVPNLVWDDKPLFRETYNDKPLFLWLGTPAHSASALEPEKKPVLLLP